MEQFETFFSDLTLKSVELGVEIKASDMKDPSDLIKLFTRTKYYKKSGEVGGHRYVRNSSLIVSHANVVTSGARENCARKSLPYISSETETEENMKFEQKNLAHVGTRTPVSMHKRLDLITKDQEGTSRQARLMKRCSRPLYIGVRHIRIFSAIGSCGRTPEAAVKK